MAENDFQIGLIGKLDGTQSKQQINSDIDALKKQLNNVEIQAKLGKDAVANLTKQLNATQINLQNVNIDQKAINKMVSQINTALNGININLGNNLNNGLAQNAQRAGQQIGQQIQNGINQGLNNNTRVLDTFRQSLQNIGMHSDQIDVVADRIRNLGVQIEALNQSMSTTHNRRGDRNILSVDISGIDKYGQAIKLTQQYNVDMVAHTADVIKSIDSVATAQQKASATTDTFIDKQKNAVTKARNTLNSIQSEYSDKNVSKPIKLQSNIDELSKQYSKVESAIANLRNADKSTFTDMQNDVDTQISKLRDMIKEYRNAENVSTKLKGTDFKSGLGIAKNDLEKFKADAKDFPKITQTITDLDKAISKVGDASSLNSFNDQLRVARSELAKIKSETASSNRDAKVGINVSGLESKILELEKISPEISNFKTQIANADVSVKSLRDDLANVQTQGDFSVVKAKLNAFTDAAKAAGYQVKELAHTSKNISIPTITSAISDNGDITTKIKVMSDNFMKLGLSADEVKAKMSTVNTELTELRKLLNANGTESDISSQYEKLNTALKATQNNLTITRSETSVLKSEEQGLINTSTRLAKANSLKAWADNNTKAMSKYGAEIEQIIGTLTSLETNLTKLDMQRIDTQINTIKSSARDTGNLGLTVFDKLNKAVEKFSGWSVATGTVMKTVSEVRNSVNELKDVDNILTEISKTSDRTKSELKTLGNESFGHASKFGLKASNWLTGVQEMNRSGFYGEQGNALADTSTLAQSAGDMTAEVANNWILATNAAYKYDAQAEKLNTVLDGANQITNRNSVNMTDLANAMTTVGSNAANAGVKVNELSALIGTAVATTKKEGNEVGTAYKSIFVNLQNTSSSKIVNTLQKAGTSMTEMKNGIEQLRSPIAILKDLAKTYNELDEKDPLRSEITRNIGGKHYANILGSTLDGWSQYEKMLQDYSEGSGSAMKEAKLCLVV